MADFKKIVDHPEKQTIITKLVSGDSPKAVSKYLKDKYEQPDEAHLRLSATLLQEFIDTYADHHGYIKKIISDDLSTKLDKKIAESLLNNKEWRKRLEETAEEHIDFKKKLAHLLTILEARAEQLFDLIQSNPEGIKTDYIFTKYMELLMQAIEKGDKIVNEKADIKIEHSYTVQMVEQQSIIFQQAIKRSLERLGPKYASMFMDILQEEIAKINPQSISQAIPVINLEKDNKAVDKLLDSATNLTDKFLDDEDE
jgi:hypothetical protein